MLFYLYLVEVFFPIVRYIFQDLVVKLQATYTLASADDVRLQQVNEATLSTIQ